MRIRPERAEDAEAIGEVTIAAFNTLPISRHTEQFIIRDLRADGALTLSLVAEIEGRIVGHIAFSPLTFSDGSAGWYGLGPVSVLPELHGKGIGSALIHQGLSGIRGLGAKGCALVGEPGYYGRFGFRNYPQMVHEGIPQEVFLALPFANEVPRGAVQFHEAFLAES